MYKIKNFKKTTAKVQKSESTSTTSSSSSNTSSPSSPPPSSSSKRNVIIEAFFSKVKIHPKTKISQKIKIFGKKSRDNNKSVLDFSLIISKKKNKKTTQKSKLVSFALNILDNHAKSIWPNFYSQPEEPAKRTMDDAGDREWIGYGEVSMSQYDTAWVAMVPLESYKITKLPKDFGLAFPQCFKWLFYNQDDEGSWCGKGAKSIPPCLAGLLALGLFRSRSGDYFEEKLIQLGLTLSQFDSCLKKSTQHLEATLNKWNINEIDFVGFELTVPHLLEELEKLEITFQFPGKHNLFKENARKMSLIPIEALFSLAEKNQPVAIIHSIEAFGNKIDFTRIQNRGFQAINGSYGSSSAATASVLINSPVWDQEAYRFLKKITDRVPEGGMSLGYVPTISDVGMFETSWMMQSMVEFVSSVTKFSDNKNNIKRSGISNDDVRNLIKKNRITAKFIKNVVKLQGGNVRWVSWENRVPPDVDITVSCHWILSQLFPEAECDLKKLGASFYNGKHFLTYPGERTVSISSNVHALRLLLVKYSQGKLNNNNNNNNNNYDDYDIDDRENDYITTMPTKTETGKRVKTQHVISTIVNLILKNINGEEETWWSDKWHTSPTYTTFKAHNLLLSLSQHPEILKNTALGDQDNLLKFCSKTIRWCLQTQHVDGSWGFPSKIGLGTLEETSYCIRLLDYSSKFYPKNLEISKALKKARKFLNEHLEEAMNDNEFFYQKQPLLWVGKQLYSVPNVIRSSILVALWEDN